MRRLVTRLVGAVALVGAVSGARHRREHARIARLRLRTSLADATCNAAQADGVAADGLRCTAVLGVQDRVHTYADAVVVASQVADGQLCRLVREGAQRLRSRSHEAGGLIGLLDVVRVHELRTRKR